MMYIVCQQSAESLRTNIHTNTHTHTQTHTHTHLYTQLYPLIEEPWIKKLRPPSVGGNPLVPFTQEIIDWDQSASES